MLVLVRIGRMRAVHGPRVPAAACFAQQHPSANYDNRDGRDDRRGPHHHICRQQALRSHYQRGQRQDSERVRQRHGQPQAGGVHGRPPGSDEVGRHQCLAVSRRQSVAGAEGRRSQDGGEQHQRCQVGGAKDRRQLPDAYAARHRGRGPGRRLRTSRGVAGGSGDLTVARCRPGTARQRHGVRDLQRWELQAAGGHKYLNLQVGKCHGQQLGRIIRQSAGRARRSQLAAPAGHGDP